MVAGSRCVIMDDLFEMHSVFPFGISAGFYFGHTCWRA